MDDVGPYSVDGFLLIHLLSGAIENSLCTQHQMDTQLSSELGKH